MAEGETLGPHLRQCREANGVSLDDLAEETRIATRHLRALEEDRLPDLPAPVFVRGFIRAYCAGVGTAPGDALELYAAERRRVEESARAARLSRAADAGRRYAVPARIATGFLVLGRAAHRLAHRNTTPPDRGDNGGLLPSR